MEVVPTIYRQPTRTSLEIAQFLDIRHADLLKVIRKMEKVWIEVGEGNFALTSYTDSQGKQRPCYELTFEQTLFVTSKYDDRQRAILIRRWKELESIQRPETMADIFAETERLAGEMREDLASGKILPERGVTLTAYDVAIYSFLRNGIKSSIDTPFCVTNTMISKALGIDVEDVQPAWERLERGGYIVTRKFGDKCAFILGSRQP
ncbi:Rha family transcriptional regulator [Lepagella muris]|uniref:Uncharacterized protein n=1 Tax=Lepagella muris TaxID=3032870 RepID=A0AC61RN53_9BACT|nr:Rha family transcriptional regulator [Lepagella muris]TGY80959.1 hypothetical protein E5331_00840 [Lepagella muris]THG54037.1 hypothetical protein E5984_00840 [Bacteroidales bacterium]TKC56708.1 hypothetical protein E5359_013185 [Bacteroidales bacterium]